MVFNSSDLKGNSPIPQDNLWEIGVNNSMCRKRLHGLLNTKWKGCH